MTLFQRKITDTAFYLAYAILFTIFILLLLFELGISLQPFLLLFLSLFLEALPFILLGIILSTLVSIYLTPEMLRRLIPKRLSSGLLASTLLGFFLPICECGIIPLSAKLKEKGLPKIFMISFLLSAPILNPISILSTYYAFQGNILFPILRVFFGIVIALLSAIILSLIWREEDICIKHEEHPQIKDSPKIKRVLNHALPEFLVVTKFFILGTLLTTFIHIFIKKDYLLSLGTSPFFSILSMMGLGFVSSICSEADAFIARTYLGIFPSEAILSFLIFGAMIDLKNILTMQHYFQRKFVFIFFITVFLINLILMGLLGFFWWRVT